MDVQYQLKQLGRKEEERIRQLFVSVFSQEPWKDDWSDEEQLRQYIQDLIDQRNSLTFGLYEGEELVGISMGRIKHWYTGTEYCIDELCISTLKQGRGIGAFFMAQIEKACKRLGFTHIFLLTERDVPAFQFYKKQKFYELEKSVAFAKKL